MSLSAILPHLSVLPQQQDLSDSPSNKGPTLEFINPHTSSISTAIPGPDQEIELRNRSSKKSSAGQDVLHSRISSVPPSRETAHYEHNRDPGAAPASASNPDVRSQYKSHNHLPSPTATTKLRFERDALFRFNPNLTIFLVDVGPSTGSDAGSKIAKYHAQMSNIGSSLPDIVLRHANTPQSSSIASTTSLPSTPPLGLAYFRWSRTVRVGLSCRDTTPTISSSSCSSEDLTWEEMRNTSSWLMHNKYEFSLELPAAPSLPADSANEEFSYTTSTYNHPTDRVHFRWQRTSSPADGVTSFWQRLSMMNYTLVQITSSSSSPLSPPLSNPPTSSPLATFLVDHTITNLRNRGTLHIHARVPRDLEVAIVLSCAAINEKACRRRCWNKGLGAGP